MKYLIVLAFAAFVYCDLKSDLLKRAEDLQKSTKDEIKKLEEQNRTALAAGLQREELRLEELAKELQSETGTEAIALLERELDLVEVRLFNEVRALTRQAQTKEQLLTYAAQLDADLKTEEDKLRADGRPLVAAALESERRRLATIAAELKTEVSTMRVAVLELEIRLLETRAYDDLRRLGVTPGTVKASTPTANPTSGTTQPPTTQPPTTQPPTTKKA